MEVSGHRIQVYEGVSNFEPDCYTFNVLSQFLPFDEWSEEEIYTCIGQPIKHKVRRLDGGPRGNNAPESTVNPGDVVALEAHLPTDRILLIHFGGAFYHHERPTEFLRQLPSHHPR
jgi:hypothetical protein